MAKPFHTVIKNIFSLVSAQIITRFISIIFIAFLTRSLGVENFGRYTTILAFAALAELFVRIGIMRIMERDVAQDKSKASVYFSTATYILIFTSLVGWGGMVLVAYLLGYSPLMIKLIIVIGISLVFQGIQGTAGSILRAFERMEILGAIIVFTSLAKCALGIGLLKMGYGLNAMIWLIVVYHVFSTILYVAVLHKKFIRLSWTFDSRLTRLLVREGSLIFIMNALMIIRGKVDIIMLSRLQSNAAVGIFGVAKKATDYLRIFREGATGAVFPRLSSIQTDSPSTMGDVFGKIIGFFVLIYLPVVVLVSFLSKDIIQILFGDKFVIGSTSLVILVWALFLNILSGPAAMLIIITKEKLAKFVPFVFFLTVFHILLNFWLIPKYSYMGASISLLILAGAGLIIRLVFIHSLLEKRPNFLEILYRPALASIFMGIAIFFSTGIHLFFRLLLAGIVYGIMLLILGEFKKGEYKELKELILSIIKRGSNEVSSEG